MKIAKVKVAKLSRLDATLSGKSGSTGRRKDEVKLLRALFAQSGHGMAIADPDGRLIKANNAFCRMLGYGAEEIEGIAWEELIHSDDRDNIYGLPCDKQSPYGPRQSHREGEKDQKGMKQRFELCSHDHVDQQHGQGKGKDQTPE